MRAALAASRDALERLASLRRESRSGPPHGLLDALRRLFDLKE